MSRAAIPESAVLSIKGASIIVDSDDVERIMSAGPWHGLAGSRRQYFVHSSPRPEHKSILLHRFIMDAQPGEEVDHINGNEFDNRKSNLRICRHCENQRNLKKKITNKSGYKGVSLDRSKKKWRARITLFGKEYNLGQFESKTEAYKAYCTAAKKLHGEFARVE